VLNQQLVILHPWLTYFKMEFFFYKVADLKIYCDCTDTALWSVLVTIRA